MAKQCTDWPAGDSGFANAASGDPYPLPDGEVTFTFTPIPVSQILRKLLRLQRSKATADHLIWNQFLQKCAPFLQAQSLFFQPHSINWFFSQRQETCKVHPSAQTLRQPVRSIQFPANISLTRWHPELPPLRFHYPNKLVFMHRFGFVPENRQYINLLNFTLSAWTQTGDNKWVV